VVESLASVPVNEDLLDLLHLLHCLQLWGLFLVIHKLPQLHMRAIRRQQPSVFVVELQPDHRLGLEGEEELAGGQVVLEDRAVDRHEQEVTVDLGGHLDEPDAVEVVLELDVLKDAHLMERVEAPQFYLAGDLVLHQSLLEAEELPVLCEVPLVGVAELEALVHESQGLLQHLVGCLCLHALEDPEELEALR